MCYAKDQDNKVTTNITDSSNVSEAETPALLEDYYFNIESVSMETEIPKDWKRFDFHGFFGVTSPVKGRDDDSQQPSSRFLDENEATLWIGKRISKKVIV